VSTVDLRAAPPAPAPSSAAGFLADLPRRVTLTLPELQLVVRAAGDAPLPFVPRGARDARGVTATRASATWADRLGGVPGASDDELLARTRAGLPDPAASLGRRGLVVDGTVDAALTGAAGLLAAPSVAVDLTVAAGGVQASAWHRLADGAVASLSTLDGLVFELAWFAVAAWPAELARVARAPEDQDPGRSDVPRHLELPLELADAAGEAQASGRPDLLPELVRQAGGVVLDGGESLDEAGTIAVLRALHAESRGRLRALVADLRDETPRRPGTRGIPDTPDTPSADTQVAPGGLLVGVRSWLLVADGWRSLRVREAAGDPRLEVSAVDPADLAGDLAPLLAEVGPGASALGGARP